MSTEHRIDITFKARYHTLGDINQQVEHVWFVCHGHGHLAEYFIKQFACLDNGKHLIIAPEGLSKYYLKGLNGRVGATWMTKEDRLNDIENYLTYLKAVYDEVEKELSQDVKITLLGFSQGAATISRFATQRQIKFDRLILWAGIFPPDLPSPTSAERIQGKSIFWVYGTKDPYLSDKVVEQQEELADGLGVKPQIISFEGEHELNEGVLLQLSES